VPGWRRNRTRRYGGRERTVAGQPDLPVRTRAACHSRAGTHWSPLLVASATATLFGIHDQFSPSALIWLVVKGFKPSPITTGMVTNPPAYSEADA
jgi:hypothetical protein